MAVDNIRELYAWTNCMLKAEFQSRNGMFKPNDTKPVFGELMIADMLRVNAAAASAARGSIRPNNLTCKRDKRRFSLLIFLIQQ